MNIAEFRRHFCYLSAVSIEACTTSHRSTYRGKIAQCELEFRQLTVFAICLPVRKILIDGQIICRTGPGWRTRKSAVQNCRGCFATKPLMRVQPAFSDRAKLHRPVANHSSKHFTSVQPSATFNGTLFNASTLSHPGLKQRHAIEMPTDDGPLTGVHHPVTTLQTENVAHCRSVTLHCLGRWLVEIFV